MLSQEDKELLSRIERGTKAGALLHRYEIPALLSEEPENYIEMGSLLIDDSGMTIDQGTEPPHLVCDPRNFFPDIDRFDIHAATGEDWRAGNAHLARPDARA